ncbi:ABC transporter permease subunit [Rhizobium rhizogenes]|uniref:ABC transporter permease subunit n=1 Tax=Rhizobium rhizogenes TaxID=359 RepID=UPI001571F2B4|nr:ABC transporter permease subunit [Rhizobium rhizogenes]NTH22830.1 ABC transporter permease subunit [Rhizobium rhizogenes]NTH35860.1 ABC transporter permease subunit [Rhizobium rhizogenes]
MNAIALTVMPDRQTLRARVIRRNIVQILIMAAVALVLCGIGYALRQNLAARGIAFSFDYLGVSAGFEMSEGLTLQFSYPVGIVTFSSEMTNAQALVAGLFNTLKVAILAIIGSTILGVLLGVGRLSTNWVIRQLCFYVVEFLRNTPLLIQLTFWYVAVVLKFPPLVDAIHWGDIVLAQQGIWIPSIVASPNATPTTIISLSVAILCLLYALGTKKTGVRYSCLMGAALLLGWTLFSGFPLALDTPTVGKFRATGGFQLTPEFAAVLIAIAVNTSAYLGEIVRGAIESLPKGQWEAAASLGFSRKYTLRDVILPQVFRVVLPSFGNQYISLAKNTSLGIAVGFPDLFNTYGTIANQTGRSMEGVIIVMIVYLLLSWSISALVNIANRSLSIPGAR